MNPKAVREFFHCIMFIPTLHFPTCHSNGFSITWRGFRAVDDRHDNIIRFHHWIYTEWSFAKWVTCENASVVSQWNIFNTISAFISPVLSNFFNGLHLCKQNKQEKCRWSQTLMVHAIWRGPLLPTIRTLRMPLPANAFIACWVISVVCNETTEKKTIGAKEPDSLK